MHAFLGKNDIRTYTLHLTPYTADIFDANIPSTTHQKMSATLNPTSFGINTTSLNFSPRYVM
jgi:hypothetical protein